MSRTAALVAAQVTAAALGLFGVYWSVLLQVMQPSIAAVDRARLYALIAIALLTAVAVGAALKRRAVPVVVFVSAGALTLAAGAWPIAVYQKEKHERAAARVAEKAVSDAAADAKALADIEARRRDIEVRIGERRPYEGQDALRFVNQVSYVDLSYLGLPDRSDTMRALLRRALKAGLIDPNRLVKGPRPVDVNTEPLFLHYYRASIRPYPDARISVRDWRTFKLLVDSGADLTLEGAQAVADDLRKAAVVDDAGRYMRLQ